MTKHQFWLWAWFSIGMLTYMLKRAYYLVTGPNPVANSYTQFIRVAWIPLFIRSVVNAGIYWLTFYPDLLDGAVKLLGLNYQFHSPMPQYAVVALFFGLGIDAILDIVITKIPYLKDWLPQMPPPMKTP